MSAYLAKFKMIQDPKGNIYKKIFKKRADLEPLI